MTSNRLNAAFAATLATAFSFAFVIATMPVTALLVTGGDGLTHAPRAARPPACCACMR